MEPFTYYFDRVNRLAISVKPKKPFKDWLQVVLPQITCTEFDDSSIYLVGKIESETELNSWLKKKYHEIFENQLNECYQDEKTWPAKITFNLFNEWFEV